MRRGDDPDAGRLARERTRRPPLRGDGASDGTFADRMLEVLRKSPVLRLEAEPDRHAQERPAARQDAVLSAEAIVVDNGRASRTAVAFVFGPENGAVSESWSTRRSARRTCKGYAHLYVIGFAIQPNARELIDDAAEMGMPATYVQATPDLMMGDLLKNMRSSQIFSVCGLPEVEVRRTAEERSGQAYQVELLGLDVFDPVDDGGRPPPGRRRARLVPRHRLQRPCASTSPRHSSRARAPGTTSRRRSRATYDERSGTTWPGPPARRSSRASTSKIAVKVIDDRGNELLVVKSLDEAHVSRAP